LHGGKILLLSMLLQTLRRRSWYQSNPFLVVGSTALEGRNGMKSLNSF
jgi:hypothetical protein